MLIDADENKIIIQAIAFQSIFRRTQAIIHMELQFLVCIVPGTDLSGTMAKYELKRDS